jgi:hypothetical protein
MPYGSMWGKMEDYGGVWGSVPLHVYISEYISIVFTHKLIVFISIEY